MASYTRQSTFSDGDLITAALFNDEYNQLLAAFENTTGHKHDGTVGEGPVIGILGDAGVVTPLNKILIDTTNDHIEFWIDVSGTSTQQLYIADGAIVPVTDNDIDLGTSSLQFKDLYINGTANIDSLVADTADINGGTIDGTIIGGTSAAAITGTTITGTTITGTSFVIGSASIDETELEILDGATLTTTELNYVDGVTSSIQTQIDTKAPLASPSLTGIPTAPTAASNTNTTQIATTAYVQSELTDLIDGAPGTLDTLNELAAAINDDANYNTTLTTALATKLPLAGGTMTGDVTYSDNVKAQFGTSNDLQIYHDGSHSYIKENGTGGLYIAGQGNITLTNSAGDETYAQFTANSSVKLYHDNSIKLATASTGVDVTGTITADALTVDDITINGSTISDGGSITIDTEGDFIVDSEGDVYLDAAGNDWNLNSAGTNVLKVTNTSGDISVKSMTSDKDLIFKGVDGGSTVTALTLDMSDAGKALFNAGANFGSGIDVTGTTVTDALTVESTLPTITLSETDDSTYSTIAQSFGYLQISADAGNTGTGDGIVFKVDNSELVRITSDGSVGIGTNSPNTNLHVYDASGGATLKIESNTANAYDSSKIQLLGGNLSTSEILLGDASSATTGRIIYRHDGNSLAFDVNGSEASRFDSSGNLLVGKTTAGVSTTGVELRNYGQVLATRSGNYPLLLNRTTSDGDIIQLRKDGTTVGSIGAESSKLNIGNGDTGIEFNAVQNAIIPHNQTSNANVDNSIDLGFSSLRFKDLHLAGTVNFGSLSDGTITITGFIDEDNMSSNSATLVPTQQSVKAYVDSQVSSAGGSGISFADNEKAKFGDGLDLEIYHDGSSSYIRDEGTGNLRICSNGAGVEINKQTSEYMIRALTDGAVELYHNNSKKIETTSTGVDVTGVITTDGLTTSADINFGDDDKAIFGADSDLQIYHDSSNSYIDDAGTGGLSIRSNLLQIGKYTGELSAQFVADGESNLYYDNSKKIATTSTGVDVTGTVTSDGLTVNGGDIRLYNNSTDTLIFGSGLYQTIAGSSGSNDLNYRTFANHIFKTGTGASSKTDGTERMRIDSSGNLMVGTTDTFPGAGDTNTGISLLPSGSAAFSRDGFRVVSMNRNTSDGDILEFRKDGTTVGSIGTDATDIYIGTTDTGIRFNDAVNGVLPYNTSTGQTDATLDLGFSSVRWKDLYLSGTANVNKVSVDGSGANGIDLEADSSATTNSNRLFFSTSAGTNSIMGVSGALTFRTGATAGSASGTERMRLDSSGNLLVGVTSTTLTGGSLTLPNSGIVAFHDAAGNARNALQFVSGQLKHGAAGAGLDTQTFHTSNVEAMRIDSSQRVGIGTTSPDELLHVEKSSGTTMVKTEVAAQSVVGFNIKKTGTTNQEWKIVDGQTVNGRLEIYDVTDSRSVMTFDGDGRVGIGTSSPGELLEVNSDGSNADGAVLLLKHANNNTTDVLSTIKFANNSGSIGTIQAGTAGSNSTGYITFNTDITNTSAERMRIHTNGYIGIGTTSPDSNVQIANNNGSSYRFGYGGSSDVYLDADNVYFRTDNGGANTATVTTTGIGIGTTSPSEDLHISGDTSVALIEGTNNATSGLVAGVKVKAQFYRRAGFSILDESDNEDFFIGRPYASTNQFVITNDGTERLRIDTSGNVGIGTSSPNASLSISKQTTALSGTGNTYGLHLYPTSSGAVYVDALTGSTSNTDLKLRSYNNGTYNQLIGSSSGGTVTTFQTGGSERMRLTSTGLGIGTTSPDALLVVQESSISQSAQANDIAVFERNADGYIKIYTPATATGGLAFGDAADAFVGAIRYDHSNNNMNFFVNNSERARIDSSGNFGIGTTSVFSGNKLDVRGGNIMVGGFGGGTEYGLLLTPSDGSSYWNVANIAGGHLTFNRSSTIGSSEEMRLDSSGRLGIGITSPTEALHVTGNILASGNVTAYSDERLKENIETLQGSKVLEMRGVSYTKDGEVSSGVIAQEIEKVAPELVHTAKDEIGTKSVAYGNLVGYLIEAIKDQQKQIDDLKERLDNGTS